MNSVVKHYHIEFFLRAYVYDDLIPIIMKYVREINDLQIFYRINYYVAQFNDVVRCKHTEAGFELRIKLHTDFKWNKHGMALASQYETYNNQGERELLLLFSESEQKIFGKEPLISFLIKKREPDCKVIIFEM